MKIHRILIIALIFISGNSWSQQSLNNYKYIIIQKKYDFLKSEDQYQLNSLTDFLFMKEGFQTLFDTDNRPQELLKDQCLGLYAKVKNKPSLLLTKLTIELYNCNNQVIFTSKEGKSKIKDYKKAYHEALRDAFQSISELNYSYDPGSMVKSTVEEVNEEKPTPELIEEIIVKTEKVAVSENLAEVEPKQEDELPTEPSNILKDHGFDNNILLYAQETPEGYQLVDSTPKVVYVMLRSSREDVYILKNINGIVSKIADKWFVEYYDGNLFIKKEVNIKF